VCSRSTYRALFPIILLGSHTLPLTLTYPLRGWLASSCRLSHALGFSIERAYCSPYTHTYRQSVLRFVPAGRASDRRPIFFLSITVQATVRGPDPSFSDQLAKTRMLRIRCQPATNTAIWHTHNTYKISAAEPESPERDTGCSRSGAPPYQYRISNLRS
jgi:hypothetical protein